MTKFRVEPRLQRRRIVFGDPRQRAAEFVWLGNLAELGVGQVPVALDTSTEHVVAIVGKRGSGKSFTLGVLIEGLGAEDPGPLHGALTPSHAVLLLDSLNIYWPSSQPVPLNPPEGAASSVVDQASLLRRWRLEPQSIKVRLWAPSGFLPNYLSSEEVSEFRFSVQDLTSQDWADIIGVDLVREPMGQALEEAWRKTVSTGWRLADGTDIPPPASPSLHSFLECLSQDRDLLSHYSPETLRAVQQRLRSLAGYEVFGSVGVSLTDLVRAGEITIMLLGEVPDDIRRVFVSVLARRLLSERSSASAREKKRQLGLGDIQEGDVVPPTWFMIDEAQNLLPAGKSTAATEALVRFVREGRNSGLSFAVATQQPSAVDARIMAQVDTLISHQLVAAKDIQVVIENLKCPSPRSIKADGKPLKLGESIAALDVGQAFLTASELERCAYVDLRPRVSLHGGFEA